VDASPCPLMTSSIDTPRRMPAAIRPSPGGILRPNGQPVSYFLYPTPRFNLRQFRPRYWLSADTKSNVSEFDRWEMVNYARQLFAQIGNLSAAIKQKNSWAFSDAWDAHFAGHDKKWGAQAEEFLNRVFYPNCNVRGQMFDMRRSLTVSGQLIDVDGDDAMVLTESESHFPKLAFFPSTRIGTQSMGARGPLESRNPRGAPGGTVQGGRYDGAKIFDGVISDRNGGLIALRIVNDDGTVTDISSYNSDLAYEPDWHDQGRGIPRIASHLLRWMSRQDIDEFLMRGMKRAASIGLISKTEEGEAIGNEVLTSEVDEQVDPNATQIAGGTPPQIAYEEVEGGEMYYLSSRSGEALESLKYENPHPNSEAFIARIEREGMVSIGWLYELINVGQTGRAPTRLACDMGNASIRDRQSTGYRRWKRATSYAIAKAMKEGFLPRNDAGADAYAWEPGFPKELSVDSGNEEQADRENLKLGTTSKSILLQKKGLHRREIERQRLEEIEDLIAMAQSITQRHPEVPFERAMELLEQRSPNPAAQSRPPAPPMAGAQAAAAR